MPAVCHHHHRYNGSSCPCIVCNVSFCFYSDNWKEDLLTHLYFSHKIFIENVPVIADITEYMKYYRKQYLAGRKLDKISKEVIVGLPGKNAMPVLSKFYLFGDFIPEDEMLRRNIHKKALAAAKAQQEQDLSVQLYGKHCFYCHRTYKTTRLQFMEHLQGHGFQFGRPNKMVYMEEFVNVIEEIFNNLCCLYCGHRYSNISQLKDHMRKAGHQKINPDNEFFDQFYLINYLQYGKTWTDFCKEKVKMETQENKDNCDKENSEESEWSNWGPESEHITCLFCNHICRSWDGTLLHMNVSHGFDFTSKISRFSFYQQVKVINYIRQRISHKQCVYCDEKFGRSEELLSHMENRNHFQIPDKELWDKSEYFFPVLRDDSVLYHLQDAENDEEIAQNDDGIVENSEANEGTNTDIEELSSQYNIVENNIKTPVDIFTKSGIERDVGSRNIESMGELLKRNNQEGCQLYEKPSCDDPITKYKINEDNHLNTPDIVDSKICKKTSNTLKDDSDYLIRSEDNTESSSTTACGNISLIDESFNHDDGNEFKLHSGINGVDDTNISKENDSIMMKSTSQDNTEEVNDQEDNIDIELLNINKKKTNDASGKDDSVNSSNETSIRYQTNDYLLTDAKSVLLCDIIDNCSIVDSNEKHINTQTAPSKCNTDKIAIGNGAEKEEIGIETKMEATKVVKINAKIMNDRGDINRKLLSFVDHSYNYLNGLKTSNSQDLSIPNSKGDLKFCSDNNQKR